MSHHHDEAETRDGGLVIAVALNLLLTVVEVVAGVLAGSLALIGDALHNGSDAGSLLIALIARRWSRRRPDAHRTFGYRRASIIGALINLTTLVVIGVYLLYEAAMRAFQPPEIDGWVMIVVATVALVVDVATVVLMSRMGKSLNIRAALMHNFADALASVGVIVAGVAILIWDINWMDPLITAVIAAYITIQGVVMMRRTIAILIDSVPADIDPDQIHAALTELPGVTGLHHIHVRQLDEHFYVMEGHVVIDHGTAQAIEDCKQRIKTCLREQFSINDSVLEFEFSELPRNDSGRLITSHH